MTSTALCETWSGAELENDILILPCVQLFPCHVLFITFHYRELSLAAHQPQNSSLVIQLDGAFSNTKSTEKLLGVSHFKKKENMRKIHCRAHNIPLFLPLFFQFVNTLVTF